MAKIGKPEGDIAVRRLRSWIWYVSIKRMSIKMNDEISKNIEEELQKNIKKGRKPLRRRKSSQTIKSQRVMTDYELDIAFAPNQMNCNLLKNGRKKGVGAARIKMFEAIRANGSIPSDGKTFKGLRAFDLVNLLDENIHFKGSAKIIHSPLWRLLDKKPLSLEQLRVLIVDCVQRLELHKDPITEIFIDNLTDEYLMMFEEDPLMTLEEYFKRQSKNFDIDYEEAITFAFGNLKPSLDLIALIGGLGFEAILAGHMAIARGYARTNIYLINEYCLNEGIGDFVQKNPNRKSLAFELLGPCQVDKKKPYVINLHMLFLNIARNRIATALMVDPLKGLPSYIAMFDKGSNLTSAAIALLNRHQRLLWRRTI